MFASSWTRAVQETTRMFEHIKTLSPHRVSNTLSMNDARTKVVAMSRPLAEMSVAMQKNIREAKEAQIKAQLADSEAMDFEQQLQVEERLTEDRLQPTWIYLLGRLSLHILPGVV